MSTTCIGLNTLHYTPSIPKISRSLMFFKIGILKNVSSFIGKQLYLSVYKSYIKETPAHVFFCENCKMFKKAFFQRTAPVPAYEYIEKKVLRKRKI